MDAIAVELIRGDGGRSFSTAVTDGPTRFSEVSPSGGVVYGGGGRGTQHECGAEAVAKLLMRRLYPDVSNARVEKRDEDDDADWTILAGAESALVQVTRAPGDQSVRRRFAQQSVLGVPLTVAEAHEAILEPIRAKTARYPAAVRADLMLALDIADLPGLAAPSVVESLLSTRLHELAAAGFASIYLVETHLDVAVRLFARPD